MLMMTCSDGRLKHYLGETVLPADWNKDTERPSNKGQKAQLTRIALALDTFIEQKAIAQQPLLEAEIITIVDSITGRKSRRGSLTYFEQMRQVVDRMEAGEILTPREETRYTSMSIKTFRFTIGFLERFKADMTSQSVTLETRNEFIVWCQGQDYSKNYIGSQIKNWKTIGKAVDKNPIYDHKDFKKMTEDADDIHLTEDQLAQLFQYELEGHTDLVRDWFILDCYTGLRISDLITLDTRNHSKGKITISNKKTGEKVIIPTHPFVKSILEKYKGFPPPVSDVIINRYIKWICEQIGFDETVLIKITKGGVKKHQYFKEWELVSCHTARRSFITNLRKRGVPDAVIMRLTGIKSIVTLQKYDKLTPKEAAEIAAGLTFFK